MSLRQAAQQALEALEKVKTDADKQPPVYPWDIWRMWVDRAITNLRAALAEPEQEPVAWMQEMPVSGNEERSVRMTTVKMVADEWGNPIPLYTRPVQALAEPEQKPKRDYRTRYDRGCYKCGSHYCPADCPEPPHLVPQQPQQEPVAWVCEGSFSDEKHAIDYWPGDVDNLPIGTKLYTAPTPQREHITDGSPCWCNPDVFEEDGGNVIVHNYEDNWQQYAKPGETAQQCIERHRSEQDALMKLYATPRRPLTDAEIAAIASTPCAVAGSYVHTFARAIERAHGIGEQT